MSLRFQRSVPFKMNAKIFFVTLRCSFLYIVHWNTFLNISKNSCWKILCRNLRLVSALHSLNFEWITSVGLHLVTSRSRKIDRQIPSKIQKMLDKLWRSSFHFQHIVGIFHIFSDTIIFKVFSIPATGRHFTFTN